MNHHDLIDHNFLDEQNMKVKCINIYSEHKKQCETSLHRLTIGNEYIVLEAEIYSDKILYRLIGNNSDQSPVLHNASQFELVSGRIPPNWGISQLKSGAFILGPESWQTPGFWEDCFEGDLTALEIYKREARIIMEEESAS